MAEWRLFDGDQAHVATAEFHAERERAPHLEQPMHRPRLLRCAALIHQQHPGSVVDLGCGDGGLLSLLGGIPAWGYDFQPTNQAGWAERGVEAALRDVFNTRDVPRWGELAVCTEVLEHLTDPHATVAWVAENARWIVASSPHGETLQQHAHEHAWAWDTTGYAAMFSPHFEVLTHETVHWSQILVGRSKHR